MRRLRITVTSGLLGLLVMVSVPAAGQDRSTEMPAPTGLAPCSYDDCAVRLEFRFFERSIVRGRDGVRVARLGYFSGGAVVKAFARSDTAVRYAKLYESRHNTAAALGLASAVITYIPFVLRDDLDSYDDVIREELATFLAAAAVGGVGAYFETRAHSALQRAIWWHNRDLVRE